MPQSGMSRVQGSMKEPQKEQEKEKRIIDALKALEGVKRLLLEVVKK